MNKGVAKPGAQRPLGCGIEFLAPVPKLFCRNRSHVASLAGPTRGCSVGPCARPKPRAGRLASQPAIMDAGSSPGDGPWTPPPSSYRSRSPPAPLREPGRRPRGSRRVPRPCRTRRGCGARSRAQQIFSQALRLANAGNTTPRPGLWYPLPMRTPRDTSPRPAPIRLTRSLPARRFIVGLLLLSLAACGQKGALYREKKPQSRLTSDAALLLP